MQNIFFDKTRFKELRSDVYVLGDVTEDTKLYKYIDLSALVDIMDGNFLVRLRKNFSDRHERGELDNPFIECMLPVGQEMSGAYNKIWDDVKQKRILSGDIPTSCFTLEPEEMYHMWKLYTQNYTGLRIETTLGKFLDALDFSGFELFVGKMSYSKMDIPAYDLVGYLFCKKLWYKPETEFRFYFISKEETDFRGQNIKIDIKKEFITEIVLSPFIPQKLKGSAFKHIKLAYDINKCEIRHSSIKETI